MANISMLVPKAIAPAVQILIDRHKEAEEKPRFFGCFGVSNEYRDSRLAMIHQDIRLTSIAR